MTIPRRSTCLLLAALPRSVGRAREYVRGVLARWQLHAMIDTVELLVSELVTNAVRATCPLGDDPADPVYLCLSTHGDVLLIEVWDTGGEVPLRRTAADDEETGRGLMLVKALSKEWGYRTVDSGGKIVWCACLIEE